MQNQTTQFLLHKHGNGQNITIWHKHNSGKCLYTAWIMQCNACLYVRPSVTFQDS